MDDEMDFDFDELLADAEQEADMYEDEMDDIEAELAMQAEASTTTPTGGPRVAVPIPHIPRLPLTSQQQQPSSSSSAPVPHQTHSTTATTNSNHPDNDGQGAMVPETSRRLSTARNASPLSLERRLGVSEILQEEEEEEEEEDDARGGYGAGGTLGRILKKDDLSPLNPVLMDSLEHSRWSGRRSSPPATAAASRANLRRPRPEESSSATRGVILSGGRTRFPVAKVDTRGVVLSRPSLDYDTISFMQTGGQMMHLKVRPGSDTKNASVSSGDPPTGDSMTNSSNGDSSGHSVGRSSLLRTPIAELMARVDERRVIERSLATAAIEAAAGNREREEEEQENHGGRSGGGEGGGRREAKAQAKAEGEKGGGGMLWVDKYAPEGFKDLLSDERVNREVLRAVKAWDPFVFKKERPKEGSGPSSKASKGSLGRKSPIAAQGGGAGGERSSDPRPEARVIMLCGPPGLGKTTLAQVVARHAGYRVYEINASDDRSATVLRKRMTEAMEGNTLLADKRPNLIVLDEVDGADGKTAAQVIVEMATAPLARATATSGSGGGNKSKKKALTRPLVLICNDQWTPALRPIRAIAQVFVFRPRASPTRLVQRLKSICVAEKLRVNTDSLTTLADRSHLDVRSCLNTLQFVARRAAQGCVTNASAALLTAIAEGIKDEKRDLFQVLRSVFTRKRAGTKRRLFVGAEQGAVGGGTYVTDKQECDVLEEVECFNDHQKVLGGLHESFLGVRFNDPTLCKASAAMDWLHFADLMETRSNRMQDYSFARYAPLAAAGMHYLCRSDQRAAVSQPKKDFEVRTARATKANILQSFTDGRQLGCTGRTTQAMVLDMLSHLMDILAPTLRPLNPDLQSPQERERFRNLVAILLSCGLTFAPTSVGWGGGGGQMDGGGFPGAGVQEFALEPAVDQLLRYDGYDFAHPVLPGPLRPIVAHEVNLETMRRTEAAKETGLSSPSPFSSPFPAGDKKDIPPPSHADDGSKKPPDEAVAAADKPVNKSKDLKGNEKSMAIGGGSDEKKSDRANDANSTTTMASAAAIAAEAAKREDGRPAYAVPFWNRTNRIAGRKDGTGASGAAQGGKEGAASKAANGVARGVNSSNGDKGTVSKRPRDGEQGGGGGGNECSKQDCRVLRYQFRSGYTNAVRRPVRMKDLM